MQPLSKYKVLSLGQAWAAPFADMMLADMGADVVKLEPPGVGDHVRKWSRGDLQGLSPHLLAVNRNKRGIVVDLRTEEGRQLALDLAAQADVLIENFSPGTMDKLGLSQQRVREHNPRLVYCSVSGFGNSGPYQEHSAYDLIVQGESGFVSVTGTEDGQMAKVGVPVIDVMAAMVSAYSIVCALIERDRSGSGRYLDISMLETATSVMGFNLIAYCIGGQIPRPLGTAHPLLAPYQVYSTASTPIAIGILTQAHWESFCGLLGREDLPSNPLFLTAMHRIDHRKELNAQIEPILRSQPAEHWLPAFQACGLVSGAVNDLAGLLQHPQHLAREFFMNWELPGGVKVSVPGMPWRSEGRAEPVRHLPPRLGEHTDEVLRDWLGLDAGRIAILKNQGAVAAET